MRFPEGIHVYGSRTYRGPCLQEKYEIEAFFALIRIQYPKFEKVAFHVRNEQKRPGKWRQAERQKKEGMVSGASDICIPGNPYSPGSPACLIELKRKDHTQSTLYTSQEEFLLANKAAGVFVCIALGADAALQAVGQWMELAKRGIGENK